LTIWQLPSPYKTSQEATEIMFLLAEIRSANNITEMLIISINLKIKIRV
jgi:hypothetical protein